MVAHVRPQYTSINRSSFGPSHRVEGGRGLEPHLVLANVAHDLSRSASGDQILREKHLNRAARDQSSTTAFQILEPAGHHFLVKPGSAHAGECDGIGHIEAAVLDKLQAVLLTSWVVPRVS